MYHVYIIQSVAYPNEIYVGCTQNLKERLSNHNAGTSPHTKKYKPWRLSIYITFDQKDKAYEFEEFLKSGSGRAFRDKRLISMPKNTNKSEYSLADLDKFLDFLAKRFGVYLDTLLGFRNNIQQINLWQNQSIAMFNVSLDELDHRKFIYGEGLPPTSVELISEKSLHQRKQGQVKIDNSPFGINYTFAAYNCLSDIYNQWKLIKRDIGIEDDNIISAIVYIRQLRDRTQHEIYDEQNVIKANSTTEMKQQLGAHKFPRFNEGDNIILTEKDCVALIQEIKLQLLSFSKSCESK